MATASPPYLDLDPVSIPEYIATSVLLHDVQHRNPARDCSGILSISTPGKLKNYIYFETYQNITRIPHLHSKPLLQNSFLLFAYPITGT